jgi:hypothetical protein
VGQFPISVYKDIAQFWGYYMALRDSPRGIFMKTLFILLLFLPIASLAQSPFDGTWITDENVWLPKQPQEYSLANGLLRSWGYTRNEAIKADGNNHKVPEASYWDTVSVRELDAHTVEIVAKKAAKRRTRKSIRFPLMEAR